MDLEAEYNNRARVPESSAIIGQWARDAAAFRESWAASTLDIPYGEGARERFDLFDAAAYMVFALVYPAVLGVVSATIGYFLFRRGDLP